MTGLTTFVGTPKNNVKNPTIGFNRLYLGKTKIGLAVDFMDSCLLCKEYSQDSTVLPTWHATAK